MFLHYIWSKIAKIFWPIRDAFWAGRREEFSLFSPLLWRVTTWVNKDGLDWTWRQLRQRDICYMLCSTGLLTLKTHTGEEFRWPLKIYKQAGLELTTLQMWNFKYSSLKYCTTVSYFHQFFKRNFASWEHGIDLN